MILQSRHISTPTVDTLYNTVRPNGDGYLYIADLLKLMARYGVKSDYDAGYKAKDLWEVLSQGIAPIALIRYGALSDIRPNKFTGSHFVVVIGMDIDTVYIHDPLNTPTPGCAIPIPLSIWQSAWSTLGDDNPQCSLIVPNYGTKVQVLRYVTPATSDGINVRCVAGDISIKTKLYAIPYGARIPIYYERDGWGKIDPIIEQWISLEYTINL